MKIKRWMGITLASVVVCGAVLLTGGLVKSFAGHSVAANDPSDPFVAHTVVAQNDPVDPFATTPRC